MGSSKRDGRWNETAPNVENVPARDTLGRVTLEMVRTGAGPCFDDWTVVAGDIGRDGNAVPCTALDQTPDPIVEPTQTISGTAVRPGLVGRTHEDTRGYGAAANGGASRHHLCSTAYLAARDLTTGILGSGDALDLDA